ncbi:MAG: hypothetical protein IJU72_09200 [Bacteroidales bacterium]|nr:hypothetical protein [Bacteroidales bacterium]
MVKPQELLKIYEIGLRHGVTEEEFNQLVLSHSIDFTAPETLEQKVRFLWDLVEVILADQDVNEDEIATLKRYCIRFGFEPNNVDTIASFLIESAQAGKTIDNVLTEITE